MKTHTFRKFEIYWWLSAYGDELFRYQTSGTKDIERFSDTHYRIKAHPIGGTDDEDIEMIITCEKGQWLVKCPSFETSDAYPFASSMTQSEIVLTDAAEDELMVIKASY